MRPRSLRVFVCFFSFLCFLCAYVLGLLAPASAQSGSPYTRDLLAWRQHYVSELTKPDGWLSLAGLEWLQSGDNSFGSAADNKLHLPAGAPTHLGVLRLESDSVQLLATRDGFPKDFRVAGQPARPQPLHVEADNDRLSPRLTIGTLQMYVIRREARFALRIKDSHSAALQSFHDLRWFEPNQHYRVTAKWTPYSPPRTIALVTLVGTRDNRRSPGVAEFALDGKTFRLEPVVDDSEENRLHFILRDTTSSTTTYAACRFLYTSFPTSGLDKPGELVLDFNHLENPPCAYTPFATCPLPPPGNRLPIALPVGEKRYHD